MSNQHQPSAALPLPDQLRLIADGRWIAPYGTGSAQADLEGDVLREAADVMEHLNRVRAAWTDTEPKELLSRCEERWMRKQMAKRGEPKSLNVDKMGNLTEGQRP